MALANLSTLFSIIILFPLVFLLNPAVSRCPKTFNCGNIEALEFPLAMEAECGLFLVDRCDPGENPRIWFDASDNWYYLLKKHSTNRFLIRDPVLRSILQNQNCFAFESQSLPKSPPYASFSISPNRTFITCYNQTFDEDIERRFGNYYNKACPPFNVYYANQSIPGESAPLQHCGAVELPVRLGQDPGGVFDLLTSEFTIEWNVSDDCHECHYANGQCLTDNMNQFRCQRRGKTNFKPPLLIVIPAVGVLVATVTLILLLIVYRKKQRVLLRFLRLQIAETKNEKDIELFLRNHGNLAQKRFKYSNLKKMTKSFRDNLGRGGFGSVYKGELADGRLVAVKILNESKENGDEFMNEVASISRTSHVNIVSLVGFCFEGSKRALVYDFMPNGSLDKFIPGEGRTSVSSLSAKVRLKWEKLFEIAIGIARGLEYLHQGCITRILHFDIKPHNILLDENFNPKISDFGLARLCPNRSSIVSMSEARGTIGYIAPEVFCRNIGEVSHRSDVYSYGMMVLEMAVGRQQNTDRSSEAYFPDWIYADLETNTLKGLHSIVKEGDHEYQFAKKMIIVGLWCIQTEPRNRPSMSNVIEMLEGA